MAQSIRTSGIIQPLLVRPRGGLFELVAGERRWRAAQLAGLTKVPAIVREIADDRLLELALIENIQRQELNPIEEANAYKRLIESLKLPKTMLRGASAAIGASSPITFASLSCPLKFRCSWRARS